VFVASFLVSMPLGVVQRIRLGHQEGFIDNAWTTAGNLAAFAAVLLAVALRVSLPWLVVAMMSVPVMVQLVNAAVLFHRAYPWLRPRWSEVRVASARAVMSTGGYFFLLQVAGAVAYQSDALILAQMIDAEATARYGVAMKLFQIMPMLMTFLHAALWPAYGEAMARGDVDWVRRTLRRSLWLAAIASGGTSMVVIAIGQPVIRWWLGPAVVPTLLMLVAMGTWTTISVVSNALGAFLNGAGILRAQAMAALLMMVANVGLSILFTRWVGASGVVWGSVVSQTVFVLVPMGIYLRWWFARQSPVAGAA
jgi:O-antigen/teichoic acid export membrane protein